MDWDSIINGMRLVDGVRGKRADLLSEKPTVLSKSFLTKSDVIEPVKEEFKVSMKTEKWIWVEGYKGTDKDMCCRGYQYELGVQHDMPKDAEISLCDSGFHLCKELSDVFDYYKIGDGNRYFKVKALVRKDEYENYDNVNPYIFALSSSGKKLVSKSIVFESEVPREELYKEIILGSYDIPEGMSYKYFDIACEHSLSRARVAYWCDTLIADGYSEAFAKYVSKYEPNKVAERAHALAALPGLSMDVKVMSIFKGSEYDD
jgi:hypothetical protein